MKLMLTVCAVACLLALAAGTFVDDDFTLVDEQTSSPVDGGEMTDIVMAEEFTTKRARMTTTTTTTSSPKLEASVDQVEATPAPASKTRKTSNRPRTSGSRRKQPGSASKAKVVDAVEEIPKAEMTSPASVDTASVSALAPKNFKPTPKPLEEFQQTQGLTEFLKKRKFERILASTTEDPFVAILATATMPSTEESVSPAVESAPIRSSSGSARRLPTTNRRFSASARATTAATTTTTPATEAPTVAAATTKRPNRFGALRNSKALATTATTTAQPVTEQAKATESTRSKLFPKRPVNLRPVANSISRRKDQATTASPTTPAAVEEDVIIPIPEEIEVIVEPTTATPLRRTRGRIAPRVSGF